MTKLEDQVQKNTDAIGEIKIDLGIIKEFFKDFKKYLLLFIITLLGSIAYNVYSSTNDANTKHIKTLEEKIDTLIEQKAPAN